MMFKIPAARLPIQQRPRIGPTPQHHAGARRERRTDGNTGGGIVPRCGKASGIIADLSTLGGISTISCQLSVGFSTGAVAVEDETFRKAVLILVLVAGVSLVVSASGLM